jgi:hypothetical protein
MLTSKYSKGGNSLPEIGFRLHSILSRVQESVHFLFNRNEKYVYQTRLSCAEKPVVYAPIYYFSI